MVIRWITDTLDHQHATVVLIDGAKVLGQVPGRAKHLILDKLGYLLPEGIALLRAVLVGGIANLLRIGDVPDPSHPEHGFPVECALILADHLGRDQLFDGLVTQLLVTLAPLVLLDIDLDLLDELLQHLVRQVEEKHLDFPEIHSVVALLQEAQDVRLRVLLDVRLVVAGLRVVHWLDRLDLADGVDRVYLAEVNVLGALLVLEVGAEEIRVLGTVEEYRCMV